MALCLKNTGASMTKKDGVCGKCPVFYITHYIFVQC